MVARDGPSTTGHTRVPETSGQPKNKLATSMQPVRDGPYRGQALFKRSLLSLTFGMVSDTLTAACGAAYLAS
jgi:hypothetical protein